MVGSINCVYETPCGWCSKWDKKCDKKLPEQKAKQSHVDGLDAKIAQSNKMCSSASDHEWECCGISTDGTTYVCMKCGTHKFYPINIDE